jgi:hypothetical protein
MRSQADRSWFELPTKLLIDGLVSNKQKHAETMTRTVRSLTYQSRVDADNREKEKRQEHREEGRVAEVRQAYHKPRE